MQVHSHNGFHSSQEHRKQANGLATFRRGGEACYNLGESGGMLPEENPENAPSKTASGGFSNQPDAENHD